MTSPTGDAPDAVGDVVLPTFTVLARFREHALDGPAAVRRVVERLTAAQEPFHETTVHADGADQVVQVRFVLVSIDAHTAVAGLSETLTAAGVAAEEVWAGPQLS